MLGSHQMRNRRPSNALYSLKFIFVNYLQEKAVYSSRSRGWHFRLQKLPLSYKKASFFSPPWDTPLCQLSISVPILHSLFKKWTNFGSSAHQPCPSRGPEGNVPTHLRTFSHLGLLLFTYVIILMRGILRQKGIWHIQPLTKMRPMWNLLEKSNMRTFHIPKSQ